MESAFLRFTSVTVIEGSCNDMFDSQQQKYRTLNKAQSKASIVVRNTTFAITLKGNSVSDT